jgi:hypothetical protein
MTQNASVGESGAQRGCFAAEQRSRHATAFVAVTLVVFTVALDATYLPAFRAE